MGQVSERVEGGSRGWVALGGQTEGEVELNKGEEQTGALAPSLDTGCINRTADKRGRVRRVGEERERTGEELNVEWGRVFVLYYAAAPVLDTYYDTTRVSCINDFPPRNKDNSARASRRIPHTSPRIDLG